jgi:hypothetical protein
MGWKAFKQHYDINANMQMVNGRLLIGTDCLPAIIIVEADGRLAKDYAFDEDLDLFRVWNLISTDPEIAKGLLAQEDVFETSINVYTYSGAQIIEKQCETLSWPTTSHDGCLVSADKFHTSRAQVINMALDDAEAACETYRKSVELTERNLKQLRHGHDQSERQVAALRRMVE